MSRATGRHRELDALARIAQGAELQLIRARRYLADQEGTVLVRERAEARADDENVGVGQGLARVFGRHRTDDDTKVLLGRGGLYQKTAEENKCGR